MAHIVAMCKHHWSSRERGDWTAFGPEKLGSLQRFRFLGKFWVSQIYCIENSIWISEKSFKSFEKKFT